MVSDRMCPAPPVVTEMDSVDCTLVMGHMGCTVQSPDNSFGGDITDACEKKNTETNHYEGASRFNLRNKPEEVINVVDTITNLSKKRNLEVNGDTHGSPSFDGGNSNSFSALSKIFYDGC
jgi:hypothetical protein